MHISGMPHVNEHSRDTSVVSSNTNETLVPVCLHHAGDNPISSGKSLIGIEQSTVNTQCAEDQLPSELPSGCNSTSDAKTLNRSVFSETQIQTLTSTPVSSSELLLPVTDEVADILLDHDATGVTRNDSPSDLVVTLSSSLTSALVEMFGPPVCDTAHGLPVLSGYLNCILQ